ncbi:MAG TPA: hypothetical protein VGO13_04710 [Solirubrobacterales bacterium]|jgi:hypothetical protein|nr:hypothetical protein [Solirubrobacterales bacterium]
MRIRFRDIVTTLALIAAALAGADEVRADQVAQLRPIDFRVFGGEYAWHADNDFRLDWDRPPVSEEGLPIVAVHYRVRDPAGAIAIAEARLPWYTTHIENIHLPAGRGAYTADVWLEGPGGQMGPVASGELRFDDARPGTAQPLAPAGWIAGNASAVLRIEHPPGAPPVSRIYGYAVSVDRGAGSVPCAGPDRCRPGEADLHSGVDADTVSLGVLPEGVNVVRAVAVSGSGMRSAESRGAIVRVDATLPAMTLDGVPPGWAAGPVRLTAKATDAMSGMAASGPSGPFTAIALDGGVPRTALGGTATTTVAGEGSHTVAFYARDAAGNLREESPSRATVRIDESPPRVAFAAAQDPADPERIEATVSDALSGPGPARGSIAVRPSRSHQPFLLLPTTASDGHLIAHWNSDSFPAGTYEFRASGYDAAGNGASSDRRLNGIRMVLSSPLKTPTAIAAGFAGKPPRGQRYGRETVYAGRLTSSTRSVLGHLPVRIVETFAAGAHFPRRATTTQTAADGSFRVSLAAGPSRLVEVAFAGTRTLGRSGSGASQLQVLSGIDMKASSAMARIGGAPVVFSGRLSVAGALMPAVGRAVELQFRLAGGKWSEFRTVQTDPHGRFRYPYSFSDDDSRGVRFQFRAFAPAQDGWPYEPAGSRPVLVTGR